MDEKKQSKLVTKNWKIGESRDYLKIDSEEMALIELKVSLGNTLKNKREQKEITRSQLAESLHASQSIIEKMETGDPSVSVNLLIDSLLSLGLSKDELAKLIS